MDNKEKERNPHFAWVALNSAIGLTASLMLYVPYTNHTSYPVRFDAQEAIENLEVAWLNFQDQKY